MFKTCYVYDPTTFLFMGEVDAQASPLEPEVKDDLGNIVQVQKYLEPANSTEIQPQACGPKQALKFHPDLSVWELLADHREETWYDQATGASTIIQTVGQPAANLAPTLPASVLLANAQAAQVNTVTGAYQAAIYAPIAYMGSTFQADSGSQSLMAQVISASGGSVPAGFAWFDATNNPVAMTFAQLQGLAQAILLRGQPLFVKLQTLKAEIRNANTIGAVTSIVW